MDRLPTSALRPICVRCVDPISPLRMAPTPGRILKIPDIFLRVTRICPLGEAYGCILCQSVLIPHIGTSVLQTERPSETLLQAPKLLVSDYSGFLWGIESGLSAH